MINKMIVEHPEFEFVKNKAKTKVLERVNSYKENVLKSPDRLYGSPTPARISPGMVSKFSMNFAGANLESIDETMSPETASLSP